MNLNMIVRPSRAFVFISALLISASFTAAQKSERDVVVETPDIQITETAKKVETQPNEPKTLSETKFENIVAKYKPTFESTEKNEIVKPFSEEVNLKTPTLKKQVTADSDWHVAVAPYLYMTGLSGEVGARGHVFDVDLSFGDILSDFKFGLMGTLEARKKKFVILNDLIWIRLKEERVNTPPALFLETDVRVKMFVWDPEIGYRLYESERGTFDVLGGFRMMSVGIAIDAIGGILPDVSAEQRKTWATPVGGFRGVVNVNEKFFLSTKFDIGGGIGADFTTQIYAGGGYKLKPNLALIGGYRYLKTDYDDDEGFLFDTAMNGFIVGLRIQLK